VPAAKQPRRDDYNSTHDKRGGGVQRQQQPRDGPSRRGPPMRLWDRPNRGSCWTPRRSASKLVPRTTDHRTVETMIENIVDVHRPLPTNVSHRTIIGAFRNLLAKLGTTPQGEGRQQDASSQSSSPNRPNRNTSTTSGRWREQRPTRLIRHLLQLEISTH
jgi:hypothetical protein